MNVRPETMFVQAQHNHCKQNCEQDLLWSFIKHVSTRKIEYEWSVYPITI